MAVRQLLGCLAVCALFACKGKDAGNTGDLDKQCVAVAKACGDKDKHIEKITDECKAAVKKQTEKGCAAKASALYTCYEKQVCNGTDRVWALDDLRVLAERHKKCDAERTAVKECVEK